MKVDVEIMVK